MHTPDDEPIASHRRRRPQAWYPVTADTPVEIRHPIRRHRVVALLFAAVIACSFAAGLVGSELAAAHTDKRVARLEADLAQRDAAEAEQNARVQQQLEHYRTSMCVLIERVPPDAHVDQLRVEYGCGPYKPPPGTPTGNQDAVAKPCPTPSPGQGGNADPPPSPQPGPNPGGPTSTPAPAPAPAQQPTQPAPAPLCVPLLHVCL